ncbi:MAG TPA: sulfite exporter TauE/SafE family protein [Candidatus Saccharimonadales bacterium]|nr:sulfite exporter TauE/SafE family protein [Candidatus Saccharimonadales bacterium]
MGIVVGVMNAIAGGGMLLGFPVMLAIGMPALIANATANIVVLPGNVASAYGYRKYLKRVPRYYLLLLIPATIGAAIGAIILRHTSFNSFEQLIPWLILFAVVLFAFQPLLYSQLQQHLHGPKNKRNVQSLLTVGLALIPLAIYGGYFGAGFGFIMLAFLGFTGLHDHIHRMNALKNIITVCIAGASIVCLYSSHLIDWHHGLFMAAGNMLGGYYGSVGAQKIPSRALRIVVIIIGLVTAAYLGLRHY